MFSHKWAEHVCYILIVILNLSSWIDLNSIFVELPLMVIYAPEGWALPSVLSLVMSLGNVLPILVILVRWKLGSRFSEIPYIYIIIIIGVIACLAIGLFWNVRTFIFGKERSLALILAVFALSLLDCTSSLVYYDYMKHFKAKYLHATFFGESLTAALPTFFALAQGVGGETRCVFNNQTSILDPVYTQPRFSVSAFFYLVTFIVGSSLIAFLILQFSSIVKLANAESKIIEENIPETSEMVEKNNENFSTTTRKVSFLSTPNSMTKIQFYILQTLNVINSAIMFGCLPALVTYSLLPYGQKAFYYCSLLYPLAYPLSALVGFIYPTISTFWIIMGSLFSWLLGVYISTVAIQSPCPIWADTLHGGILMTTAWFVSSLVLAYVRLASGNRIRLAWPKESGLFNFGVSVQMGMFVGALPVYLVINVYELLYDRVPCVAYCQ